MRYRLLLFCTTMCLVMLLAGCNLAAGSQPTPFPTPDIPSVEILSPANNQQVFEGTVFDIDIVARDETAGVARIELLVDDNFVNEVAPDESEGTSVPALRVKMNWLAQGAGFHIIEVVAYREDGTRSDSALLNIDVISRDAAPDNADVEPTLTPTPDV